MNISYWQGLRPWRHEPARARKEYLFRHNFAYSFLKKIKTPSTFILGVPRPLRLNRDARAKSNVDDLVFYLRDKYLKSIQKKKNSFPNMLCNYSFYQKTVWQIWPNLFVDISMRLAKYNY